MQLVNKQQHCSAPPAPYFSIGTPLTGQRLVQHQVVPDNNKDSAFTPQRLFPSYCKYDWSKLSPLDKAQSCLAFKERGTNLEAQRVLELQQEAGRQIAAVLVLVDLR